VRKGTRLIIYKGDRYVGDILITRAHPNGSVGVVKIVAPNEKVQSHDLVISGPGI
jgi:hypothetical protein